MGEKPAVPAPAATATLRILQYLARQRGPVAAAMIASALELPRSRVYQLLRVLEEHGFVLHFPAEQRWGLGYAASELGSGFTRSTPLAYLGAPLLTRLVARTGESAHLAVLSGADVVYIVEERAPRRPSLVTDVGVRLPSHLTASGRAILSRLPWRQVLTLYPNAAAFVSRGPGSEPRTVSALRTMLGEVRERGWASEHGEVTAGLASVAVPVLDHAGWPVASVAVTFAEDSVVADRPEVLIAEVRRVADALSRALGGQASAGASVE